MNRASEDDGLTGNAGGSGSAHGGAERTAHDGGEEVSRRRFLEWITVAAGSLAAAIVAVPVLGFTLAPVFRRFHGVWTGVGPAQQFAVGDTVEVTVPNPGARAWAGPTGKTGAWLRRVSEEEFTAYSVDCTHLGCPVRWEPSAQLFLCPCHGGVYYADGRVAGGPPPRPLVPYPVRVRSGQVEVRITPLPLT
jgi:menaquinol-cytochrome c reductase iron-sulfur subunit